MISIEAFTNELIRQPETVRTTSLMNGPLIMRISDYAEHLRINREKRRQQIAERDALQTQLDAQCIETDRLYRMRNLAYKLFNRASEKLYFAYKDPETDYRLEMIEYHQARAYAAYDTRNELYDAFQALSN